jgi:hypothetical protein
VTLVDPRTIAERLGVPQEAVRKVQRHGFLRWLDLDEREIRERLWRAHLAYVRRRRCRFETSTQADRRGPLPKRPLF